MLSHQEIHSLQLCAWTHFFALLFVNFLRKLHLIIVHFTAEKTFFFFCPAKHFEFETRIFHSTWTWQSMQENIMPVLMRVIERMQYLIFRVIVSSLFSSDCEMMLCYALEAIECFQVTAIKIALTLWWYSFRTSYIKIKSFE